MQSEGDGRVAGHGGLDMLNVLLPGGGRRGHEGHALLVLGERVHLGLVQQLVFHVEVQVGVRQQPVVVVHDVTSVHDLAEDVLEIRPGDLAPAGVLHVVRQALGAVQQVANAERVLHIEAQRAVHLALDHDGVEVAQAKDDAPLLAVRLVDLLPREGREGPLQVGLQAGWRLVRELDAAVENPDRDALGRIAGDEEAELLVTPFFDEDVQALLKLVEPARHQVDVIQDDPVAVAVRRVQVGHGDHVLALAHGHVVVGHALDELVLVRQPIQVAHHVGARRQDEVDGRRRRGIEIRLLQYLEAVERGVAVHVGVAVG
eukprot:scaffold1298_cov257-Pinguiococcus_pyrenoidosus.AAC.6